MIHNIKSSQYRIGIKFDKDPLAVKQNNHISKIVNVYVVYDLDSWLRNPTNNFKFKICLFGANNIVRNSDKEKYVYSSYEITINSAVSKSFDNSFARNVMILQLIIIHYLILILMF